MKRRKQVSLIENADIVNILDRQWTELDEINALLAIDQTARFLPNELYLTLRLCQMCPGVKSEVNKSEVARRLDCDEKTIRDRIQSAKEKFTEYIKNCVILLKNLPPIQPPIEQ